VILAHLFDSGYAYDSFSTLSGVKFIPEPGIKRRQPTNKF
jgi:hypothetical protein